MGLNLRTASAKLWLAAMAAGLLGVGSSHAACSVNGTGLTVTAPGSVTISSTTNAEISGTIAGGIDFTTVGSLTDPQIDLAVISTVPNERIKISDFLSTPLGTVCYEGSAGADIDNGRFGLVIGTSGDGTISAAVNHRVTASDYGVSIDRSGSGDIDVSNATDIDADTGIQIAHEGASGNVDVATAGDITAADAAISVERFGLNGDISITTATGTTLAVSNGSGYDVYDYAPGSPGGSMGIRAVRGIPISQDGDEGSISIINGADVAAAYVGIDAELYTDEGEISIASTGDITVVGADSGASSINGVGIGALSEASGNVTIASSGDITAPDFGIFASHNGDDGDLFIETASGSEIVATGGDGGTSYVTGIAAFRGGTTGDIVIRNGSAIEADSVGISAEICNCTIGNIDIVSSGVITVDRNGVFGTGVGIEAYHGGEGETSIVALEDITAPDAAIQVESVGALGNIFISTASGKSLVAQGGAHYIMGGAVGIAATRNAGLAPSATGTITIRNASSITADALGIFAGDLDAFGLGGGCGCSNDIDIDIESSGDISVANGGAFGGAGIVAFTIGDAGVRVTGGEIETTIGVLVFADRATIQILKDAVITSTGVTSPAAAVAATTNVGADVTVAGKITAQPGDAAIRLLGAANTLTLEPGFDITGSVVAIGASNGLVLGGTGSGSFDLSWMDSTGIRAKEQYFGFTAGHKTGTSTWTVTDTDASFAGTVTADAGKVVINSAIPGLNLVLSGTGAIGGSGSFNSLTATGGILAPGNSIGTLTVGAINVAGVVYQVETNAAGASDKVIVTGTATIDAATSSVLAMPETGAYAKSTTYTILTAGTLNGGFGSVSSASPLFLASLSKDTSNIYLTLTRNVAGAGVTPNQKATGTGLDSVTTAAPYFANLMALPSAQIPGALSAISGDGYASLMTALITDQRYLRDAVLDRLTAVRFTPEPIIVPGFASDIDLKGLDTPRVWGRAYGGLSAVPADGNGPAINRGTGGVIGGADADLGDFHAGVVAAIGGSSFAIPDRNMSGTTGEASIGAYGDTEWDDFYLSVGATLTAQAISTTRTATFAGVNDTYIAQYGALTSQAFSEIGYRIETGATTLAPFAGLALVNTTTAGFTEAGTGPGALTVAGASISAAVTTLGVRLERQFILSDHMLVTLSGSAAWRHGFGGMGATSNAFAGGGPFTVLGAPLAADQIAITAGADLDISEDLAFGLAYSGVFGSGGSHGLTATLSGHL